MKNKHDFKNHEHIKGHPPTPFHSKVTLSQCVHDVNFHGSKSDRGRDHPSFALSAAPIQLKDSQMHKLPLRAQFAAQKGRTQGSTSHPLNPRPASGYFQP